MEEYTQQEELQPTSAEAVEGQVEETYTPPEPNVEEAVEASETSDSVSEEQPVLEEQTAPVVTEPNVKVGDRVRIFIDPPAGVAQTGTVRVVQNVPGKTVGVELDSFTDRCHALDGLVEERVDETRGVVVGKGWWTREENIEVLQ